MHYVWLNKIFIILELTSIFNKILNTKGSIVNFSSTYGCGSPIPSMYTNGEKHIGYGVSKAGVIQLTKHLAVHLAPNIRVNCVSPGGVKFNQDKDKIYSLKKLNLKKYKFLKVIKRKSIWSDIFRVYIFFLKKEKKSFLHLIHQLKKLSK